MEINEKEIEKIAADYFSSRTPGMALLIGEGGRIVFPEFSRLQG